jgi:outer membrane protein OmpA-like peptidoglycan-associated protein
LLLSACQTAPVTPKGLSDEQIAALKEVGFVPTDEGWELSQSDKVLFALNVATLTSDARQNLERIGKLLVKIQIDRVRVDGHTDSEGTAAYNQQLSVHRARSVADVLIQAGVAAKSVTVRGLGETAPVEKNQTSAGRAQNRRVAIVITVG